MLGETYFVMNLVFICIALLLDIVVLNTRVITKRKTWILIAVMMVLTLVFDNLLVGLGIVTYDAGMISGLRLGYAPIEDFAYTFVACILIPALFERYGTPHPQGNA